MLRLALNLTLLAVVTLTATATGLAQDAPAKTGIQERRNEGEQLLKSMRDRARVAFAKTGATPRTLTGEVANSGCGAKAEDLVGKHYTAKDRIHEAGKDKLALIAEPLSAGDGVCLLKFNVADGTSTTTWYDTTEALKKDNADITFEAEKDKATDTGGKDDATKDVDPYLLWKKKGRMWLIKNTMKLEGMDPMVSYMKTEITEVAEDYAQYKVWMLDKDKEPMEGMPEPTATKIEFKEARPVEDPNAPKIEVKEETVEVTAGKFQCIVTEVSGTKVWSSKKYPGLTIKIESETYLGELVEFKE